jgi:hypothetical protein
MRGCSGRVPTSIGVASGDSKVRPILGALRAGVMRTLVTDVATAEAVVALDAATSAASAGRAGSVPREPVMTDAILGIDLGTTEVKAGPWASMAGSWPSREPGYGLEVGHGPGWAEQDPARGGRRS